MAPPDKGRRGPGKGRGDKRGGPPRRKGRDDASGDRGKGRSGPPRRRGRDDAAGDGGKERSGPPRRRGRDDASGDGGKGRSGPPRRRGRDDASSDGGRGRSGPPRRRGRDDASSDGGRGRSGPPRRRGRDDASGDGGKGRSGPPRRDKGRGQGAGGRSGFRDRRGGYSEKGPSRGESNQTKQLVATCALGLELVVGRELEALGLGPVSRHNAQVCFPYSPEALAKANYWLRSADRVWLQLAEFPCSDFEELFQGVKAIEWHDLLPRDSNFPVEVISTKSKLESVSACQSVAKKAVVEKMQSNYGMAHFPEVGARFAIRVFLVYNHARVFIDTSGEGLHRRGYRTYNAQAPLRETVAAALVLLSHWNVDRDLYDPMCGSGTILLEAASIGLRKAAGLDRSFASQRWEFLGRDCWAETHEEAKDLYLRRAHLRIYGSDNDGRVLKLARQHLSQSGFDGRGVHFQKRDLAEFSSQRKYGVLITNPPYGRRLGTEEEVAELTRTMGEVLGPLHETWSLYFYSGFEDFAKEYGREPERNRKIYNGKIPAYLYQYPGPKPPEFRAGEDSGGEPTARKRIRISHDHSPSSGS